jgi:hypothetical protein
MITSDPFYQPHRISTSRLHHSSGLSHHQRNLRQCGSDITTAFQSSCFTSRPLGTTVIAITARELGGEGLDRDIPGRFSVRWVEDIKEAMAVETRPDKKAVQLPDLAIGGNPLGSTHL